MGDSTTPQQAERGRQEDGGTDDDNISIVRELDLAVCLFPHL